MHAWRSVLVAVPFVAGAIVVGTRCPPSGGGAPLARVGGEPFQRRVARP